MWFFNKKKDTYVSTISRTVIDKNFTAIVLVDKNSIVLEWNDKAQEIFGWSKEEVIGEKITSLFIPRRFASKHNMGMRLYFESKVGNILSKKLTLPARDRYNREFNVDLQIEHVKTKGKDVFIAFISDKSLENKMVKDQQEYSEQLNGRVRTTMSIIQAIAKQTLPHNSSEDVAVLMSRLFVVDKALSHLYKTDWKKANLYELVYDTVYMYARNKISIKGNNEFYIKGNNAISFALIVHELCINATNFGALNKDHSKGHVTIDWHVVDNSLIWTWVETNGPVVVVPKEIGFGIQFIKRAFTGQGTTIVEFLENGLSCTIVIKLEEGN